MPLNDPGLLASTVGGSFGVPEVLMALLGSLSFTQEFRYGTVTATYLGEPRRPRILAAKLVSLVVLSIVATVSTLVLAVARERCGDRRAATATSPSVPSSGRPSRPPSAIMAAYGVIGVALGALIRNQVAAVVAVLVWMLAVEYIVIPTWPVVGRWLPLGVSTSLLQLGPSMDLEGKLLPAGVAALVLVVYTLGAARGGGPDHPETRRPLTWVLRPPAQAARAGSGSDWAGVGAPGGRGRARKLKSVRQDNRRETSLKTIEHWIAGKATSGTSERTAPVYNPATGAQQAEVLLADVSDVEAAIAAASDAFPDWSQTSISNRTKVLFAFREIVNARAGEIASVITDEHGKVLSDAMGEVQRGLEVVEFACGIPSLLKGDYSDQVSTDVDTYSFREPLGVVAGITPFNFPAMVPMWMFPVAIACGNTFVLKPSERDPSASILIARMWQEAGLPDGVFNVVHGDKTAVDTILDSPDVAAVSFVGSTPIAKYIHERGTATGKRVQALGGAKNHAIILPDADIDFAADHLAAAAFGSAGERCMAISAAVAVGDAGDRIVEAVNERARAVKVGSGRDSDSEMGPVVTREAQQRIVGLIGTGEEQGATISVDGRNLTVEGYEDGFFVGPTVIDGVSTEMDVYTQEIFGPVLSVVRTDTVDEAIALINANPYGNGTAIFTNSGESARRFQRGVHVGMIGINVPVPVPMAYYSFGGWKDSLFGDKHVHGPEGVSFYTRAKVVTARWPRSEHASDASFHFPTSK